MGRHFPLIQMDVKQEWKKLEQVPAKLERSNHKKDVALEILTDPLLR
jgi:hypothetical protein